MQNSGSWRWITHISTALLSLAVAQGALADCDSDDVVTVTAEITEIDKAQSFIRVVPEGTGNKCEVEGFWYDFDLPAECKVGAVVTAVGELDFGLGELTNIDEPRLISCE